MMSNPIAVQGITKGFTEDIALRQRYEKEGFGLETGFERRDWAEERIANLRQEYNLVDSDTRLVKHISSPETGKKTTWEVYVIDGKGVEVLFL
jgi:hypothetical protein